MPLTAMQARDRYLIGSMALFLDRNLKQAYDVEAAATATAPALGQFPKPLTITSGKPDNVTVIRAAPSIAISIMPSGEKGRWFELGSATVWRHRSFMLSCYPSLDGNGSPSDVAHQLLRSYVQDAFETEAISVVDYVNSTTGNIVFLSDVMYVRAVSDPIDRAQTTALAEEKHRFDVHVTVQVAVIGSLAT